MADRTKLTPREADCLEAICEYMQDWGYPPSVRDVADDMAVSVHWAAQLLDNLEAKGWIVRDKGKARAITITEERDND